MGNKRIDPRQQFSKWLARWTTIFWFVFMSWLGAVLFLAPESGLYAFYLSIVVSFVMIFNLCLYHSNSKREKELFALLNGLELELKFGGTTIKTGRKLKEDEPDSNDEEGESNG